MQEKYITKSEKETSNKVQPSIGMDVSCHHFHAAIYPAQGQVPRQRWDNTLKGVPAQEPNCVIPMRQQVARAANRYSSPVSPKFLTSTPKSSSVTSASPSKSASGFQLLSPG